jgi:hypothetical protein
MNAFTYFTAMDFHNQFCFTNEGISFSFKSFTPLLTSRVMDGITCILVVYDYLLPGNWS